MKTFAMIVPAVLLASTATAGTIDLTFDLGSIYLEGAPDEGSVIPVNFNINVPATPGAQIVGFSFEGDYSFEENGTSWASDTRLQISGDGSYDIGGLADVNPWDQGDPGSGFPQGGGSTALGFYGTEPVLAWEGAPIDASTGASFDLAFTNAWYTGSDHDIEWTNAVFTIHMIPAPGAFALLGVAGLAARRRRR